MEQQATEQREFTCMVEFNRQFYPKDNKKIMDGDWGIVTVRVHEIEVDGEMLDYNKLDFNNKHKDYALHIDPRFGTITIKGNMCEMHKDTRYKVSLKEVYDSKYERWGYDIKFIQERYSFDTVEKQRKFLLRILTERQVDNIFATFESPMEILENNDVEALTNVKGIGEKTAQDILSKFMATKDFGKAFVELSGYGLTNAMIYKLVDRYGSPDIVVSKVKNNPYILAHEVDGIGFLKADAIALSVGYDPNSPKRCSAYLQYFFDNMVQEGHSYVTGEHMMDAIYDALGNTFNHESISLALRWLTDKGKLWFNEDRTVFASRKHYEIERLVALNIIRLVNAENNFYFDNWEEKIAQVEAEQGWQFTDEQYTSIQSTLEHNVVVTAGYGGTGKSSSVSGMLRVLEGYTFAQCALSGKASVNMMHITGADGYTIHRLLGYNPQTGWKHSESNPLEYDIIILDEFSMVDAELFARLLCAIKDGAKLIMLGDTGQLTNIGIGNVMHDLIESGYVWTNQLTQIHRQAAKSAIITESIKLRNSEHIVKAGFEGRVILGELQDLEIIGYKEHENRKTGENGKGVQLIMDEYLRIRPNVSNIMDISVILPTNYRGTCTYKLNLLIQAVEINHKKGLNVRGLEIGGDHPYTLYIGDKVINTKNNYQSFYREYLGEDEFGNPMYDKVKREIYNGNMGIVTAIDHQNREIEVDFERIGKVTITADDLSNIHLGYAISVHKSQGATIPYVIVGLDYSHFKMLSRELVYTAITRAKTHCILVAETRALRRATTTTNIVSKQTFLPYFLDGTLPIL